MEDLLSKHVDQVRLEMNYSCHDRFQETWNRIGIETLMDIM